MSTNWNARTILKNICDTPLRQSVLEAFWTSGNDALRMQTLAQLATSLRFRPETLRKAPTQRKAELLGSRMTAHEFEEALEIALMTYHTTEASELLAAFLDEWGIPHQQGTIESEDYPVPSGADVVNAVEKLRDRFPRRNVVLYLATAGLLMGEALPKWREATWPLVETMAAELETSAKSAAT